jgi:bacteriocin biosynthesis cyclodehydratase domain-containing protein
VAGVRYCARLSGTRSGQALVPRLVSLLDETGLRSRQVRDPGTRGTLGVLVGVGEPDRAVLDPWLRANVPHLLVRVVEGRVRIGPLVVPGTTACVRCVDAHHCAADPAWPLLVTQYSSASSEDRADGAAEPVDPLLAAIGLGWAARDLVTYVDGGRPTTWSSTVTLADDLSTIETRTWLRHPDCGCGWT